MRIDEISLGQIGAGIKGAIAGAQQSAQTRKVAQNTQALAQTALSQWGKKVVALTNAAGGQPVDPTDYTTHLTDFVQKVLLGGTRVQDLDTSSQPKVSAAIKGVVDNRADRGKLPQAFNALVTQASVARPDPAKVRGGGATTAGGFVTTSVPNLQIAPATQNTPTIVKFKNDIYQLNDRNQWLDKNDRPASETMAALLTLAAQSL